MKHNLALVRRVVDEIWNRGVLDVADALFAPDYVNHGGLIVDLVRGPEAIKLSVALYRRAFPDLQLRVVALHAEGDRVVLGWVARSPATAAGSGSAAGGRHGTVTGTTVSRVAEGRIVESWTQWDQGGVLAQLGLIPSQAVAGGGPRERRRRERRRPAGRRDADARHVDQADTPEHPSAVQVVASPTDGETS